ncbi:MAG: hypothetical protein ACTHZ9_13125 [Leucobacter sp.]
MNANPKGQRDKVAVALDDGDVVYLKPPRIPRKSRIPRAERETAARSWLVEMHQTPTQQRVEVLSAMVGRFAPHTQMGRIASGLVGQGQLPTKGNVVNTFLRQKALRARGDQRGRIYCDAMVADGRVRTEVLDRVRQHWEEHGRGPTWSQLLAPLNIGGRLSYRSFMARLVELNLVAYTSEPGSLRVVR